MADSETATLPTSSDALLARLGALGIEYELHTHPPLFTVDDSKALRGDLPGGHCKNLFLRDRKGAMWLVVCLEDRKIDLKALGAVLGGVRLSFGSRDRLIRTLGVLPGAVSPFALINDSGAAVTVILDAEMMGMSPLNYHPLSNEMTVAVTPDALTRFIEACGHTPQVIDLSAAAGD
ncbi:MAG: prolyl-tRNA synthetase associated domain-containing protein [Alphaproteobacteria bacterium]|nr:prolyl-tRNA synthetase associated domain-containing protein [Alphaproteobacteria bacterium]